VGRLPSSSPGVWGRTASSSFTETSSGHAGRGGSSSHSQGAAPRPPSGRRLRRAPRGQCPCPGRPIKGEDLPTRSEASADGGGFSTDEIANSVSSPGSPSPGLNGCLSSSGGESPSAAPQARPHRVGLFVPAGGTGVPFVMALRMPGFLFTTALGA
jgi:hypothetical protein